MLRGQQLLRDAHPNLEVDDLTPEALEQMAQQNRA